jgi:FkbM family methyltransferase
MNRFGIYPGFQIFYKFYLSRNKSIKLNKQQLTLRKNSSDVDVFNQVYLDLEYNINLDFEPKIIVDVGANIGLTTRFFKNKYPKAKIISIEPEINNFEILVKNCSSCENIFYKQNALWNTHSKIEMTTDSSFDSFKVTDVKKDSNTQQVQTLIMDDLLKEFDIHQIDILKIDIEGAEKEVFAPENNMEWLTSVKLLIIELHDNLKTGCSQAFFKALSKHNYSLSISGELIIIKFL